MADQEVVIVDAHNVEHVFPAGFDPQKAAAIVREQAAKPLNVHDANTGNATLDTLMGIQRGAAEGVVGGAKGFVQGVIPGAYHAVIGAVPGLVNAALGAAKGTGRLLTDPVGTLTEAYNTVKGTPGKASETLQSALDLARSDPEAFGKAVGEMTGATEAGIGMSAALPLAPKPVARFVGPKLSEIGKAGKWPIRMMGAHQLGSGNPMGLATMMIPEGLQKTGSALTNFGESDPALVSSAIDKFRGPRIAPPSNSGVKVNTTPDAWDRARSTAATVPSNGNGGFSAAEKARLKQQGYAPETIAKLEQAQTQAPIRATAPSPAPVVTPPSVAATLAPATPAPTTPFQQMKQSGEFGGERTTGSFPEGPGGLSSITPEQMQKLKTAGTVSDIEPPPEDASTTVPQPDSPPLNDRGVAIAADENGNYAGPDRRQNVAPPTVGQVERRQVPASNAEKVIQMRQENPNIDAEAAAMKQRAAETPREQHPRDVAPTEPDETSLLRDSRSKRSVSPVAGMSQMDLELLRRTIADDPNVSPDDLASMVNVGRFSRQKIYASPSGRFLDQLDAANKVRQGT